LHSIHDDVYPAPRILDVYRSAMNDDQSLSTLMRAAQAGDTRAYVRLLRDVTPRLRQVVRGRRRFLNAEDIEDLVQDILLSLHAVRATYDPQRAFMPWLMAIARNRLADGARRYARQEAHELHFERSPVTFPTEETNIDDGAYRDPEALRQAIRELPPGQRRAIEMLKLKEMSLNEAAAASGMSIGSLKVSVHRAMASLRRTMAKQR
jgi:RNA polymerase sigma factor (sigma-70 family)